jgi:signal transduction histidine kinase
VKTASVASAAPGQKVRGRARTPSLKFRLITLSLAWLAFSLVATGFVLFLLFRADTQRNFDDALRNRLVELAAGAQAAEGGRLDLGWTPADPRFNTPLSGWYWELRAGDAARRSPSLLDRSLPVLPRAPNGVEIFDKLPGPQGVALRIAAQDITIPGGASTLSVRVAGPCSTVQGNVLAFMGWLAAALATLGVTLGGLIVAQVVYGLRPLGLVRAHLARVRQGGQDRLEIEGPSEIAPLIEELDALLAERAISVAEARAEAGNLAHALKTPLAVIRNETRALAGDPGAVIAAEADRMVRVVEHHLVSARVAIERRRGAARASLDSVMDDVRFTLERLYPGRRLVFAVATGLKAACAEDDLGEMIGNLADNACKWASTTVRISAAQTGASLQIEIADDGPGLSDQDCVKVLEGGGRLDECVPGHGLGISIAMKLAAINKGSIRLERSNLGGLAAIIAVPV